VRGTAGDVVKRDDGKYEVLTEHTNPEDGSVQQRVLVADAVVIATGPVGLPNIPPQFAKANREAPGQVIHTAEMFAAGVSLEAAVGVRCSRV
jgi:cation diffusion facilitator CzcD-associated flavoprotein CzcO